MNRNYNLRIALLAAAIFAFDQITKWSVIWLLPYQGEVHVLPGFFSLVHVHNTGAAWSMFHGNNFALGIISCVALVILVLVREKFGASTHLGSISLGIMFGGIMGNIFDRFVHGHVIDFLHFHLITRSGAEHNFPAFNVADSAICIGVGLLFLLSWRPEPKPLEPASPTPAPASSTPAPQSESAVRDIPR